MLFLSLQGITYDSPPVTRTTYEMSHCQRHHFNSSRNFQISALLAFSAIINNDRVGLLIFTEDVEVYIPPKKGRKHVLRVIRELLYFQPRGTGTSIAGALEYVNRLVHRRSVFFLISDFIDRDYARHPGSKQASKWREFESSFGNYFSAHRAYQGASENASLYLWEGRVV